MDKTNMRLSIVVNMYNTATFLPRCMESLIEQDIAADTYEIILVDDGSTDASLSLALEYARQSELNPQCPKIHVEHHTNKGLSGARNTGLKAAKGKFLCFVDPDDYIEKSSLATMLKQMEEENLDILRFNYQKVDEQGIYLPDKVVESNFDYSPQLMTGVEFVQNRLTTCCYVWAYIYRLELIIKNNIWFDESCYFDDTPWLPRVLPLAKRINCVDTRHLYYTQRAGSLVHTLNNKSVKQKVDGQIRLLEILCEQKMDNDLHSWYLSMYSLIVLSILTSVAVHLFDTRHDYLKQLKKYNIYPLSKHKALKKNIIKINLINFSPKLYVWLVHFIRKIHSKQ